MYDCFFISYSMWRLKHLLISLSCWSEHPSQLQWYCDHWINQTKFWVLEWYVTANALWNIKGIEHSILIRWCDHVVIVFLCFSFVGIIPIVVWLLRTWVWLPSTWRHLPQYMYTATNCYSNCMLRHTFLQFVVWYQMLNLLGKHEQGLHQNFQCSLLYLHMMNFSCVETSCAELVTET